MPSLSIVPTFNVVEDREARRLPRRPVASLDQLPLQRREVALNYGIVVAVVLQEMV